MTRPEPHPGDEAGRGGASGPFRALMVVDAASRGLARSLEGEGVRVVVLEAHELDAAAGVPPVDAAVIEAAAIGDDAPGVCGRLARDGGPAVILLGAGDEEARVAALDAGAWCCPAGECGPRELAAIIRAAARERRAGGPEARRRYLFAGWRLDVAAHELTDPDGALVALTDGEFAVLRSLVERPRRVLSRETLLVTARGGGSDAFDRAVDTQISRIRRKLRASGDELIRTVRNEGYLFVPAVTAG